MQKRRLFSLVIALCLVLCCSAGAVAEEGMQATAPAYAVVPVDGGITSDGHAYSRGYIDDDWVAPTIHDANEQSLSLMSAPASFDLRNVNGRCYVTPIRNQNPYGTCWAFGTVGSAESNLLMDGVGAPDTLDLSELQLVYYTYVRNAETSAAGGGTINDIVSYPRTYQYDILHDGGNASDAATAMANWLGLIPEANMVYKNATAMAYVDGRNMPLRYAYSLDSVHLQNAYRVNSADTDAIKALLQTEGAAAISYFDNSYDNNGVTSNFNPDTGAFYQTANSYSNHAVTLIGWDDNYAVDNFNSACRPSKPGAWLCKNSWGTWFGQDGYFWISYEEPSFQNVIFFDVSSASDYDYLYQYDGGRYSANYYAGNTIYGANVFTAARSEQIVAVSFETRNTNVTGTIRIFTGVSSSTDPTSGTCALTQSFGAEATRYAGFHTIDLNTVVNVTAGQKFSVVLTLNCPGNNVFLVYDAPLSGSRPSAPTASAGQSFYSANGSYWYDISDSYKENLRIKAKTGVETVSTVPGDVNNDGQATVRDGVLIARHIAGLATLSPGNQAVADVYQNNMVDVTDILYLCKYIAGACSSLPVTPS